MLILETKVNDRFDRLAFSPSGRNLAAGGVLAATCWNLDTGEATTFSDQHAAINSVSFLRDGRLVVGFFGSQLLVFDSRDGTTLRHETEEACRFCSVSPVAMQILRFDSRTQSPLLRCFRLTRKKLRQIWQRDLEISYAPVIATNGEWFAVCQHVVERDQPPSHKLTYFDIDTGKTRQRIPLTSSLPHMVLSQDNTQFASLYQNHVRYWTSLTPSLDVRVIENDTQHYCSALAFHPTGRYLAATSDDLTVKIFETATWAIARIFTWDIGRMRSISFSPDGTLAAAGSDSGKVIVWDIDL